jgi:hypothetical protein
MEMKKVKIKVVVKAERSSTTADFESGIITAPKPATPLQTLIEAACYLARMAEAYKGAGDVLKLAVGDAVESVKEHKAASA